MSVDRGGIRYEIDVGYLSGSKESISAFRADISAARADWRAFKDELANRGAKGGAAELDLFARAAKDAAASVRGVGESSKKAKGEIDLHTRAVADNAAALDKKIRKDEQAAVAAEGGFEAERRLASAQLQRSKAEEQITKTLDKRLESENRLAAAKERSVDLSAKEARSLKVLTDEELRQAQAQDRLAAAKQRSTDPVLQGTNAETQRLGRIEAAKAQLDALDQVQNDQVLSGIQKQIIAQNQLLEAAKAREKVAAAGGIAGQTQAEAETEAIRRRIAVLREEAIARIQAKRGLDARGNVAVDDTRELSQRARAIEDQNKAFDAKERAANAAAVAEDRDFVAERRLASAAEQRAAAEETLTELIERRSRAQNLLDAAAGRGIELTEAERRELSLLTREEERLYLAKKKLADAEALNNPDLIRIKAEAEALRLQAGAAQKGQTQTILQGRGLGPTGAPAIAAPDNSIRQKIREFLGLRDAIDAGNQSASRASFSFQRLFGVFAAFTAVRLLLQEFRALVGEAIRFNAVTESARVGIAGILASAGDVRDATGASANAADRLAIAESEAAKQVAQLRKDALTIPSSFEDLARAFQEGLGPGLQAGLNPNQIREFTKSISVAASSLGLAQNQLPEELRSILSGTINPRNTRIAQALHIENVDIKNAKEAGKLMEFLQRKFAAFDVEAEKAGKTLPGAFTRVKEALSQILGGGSAGATNDLRKGLLDVLASAVQIDSVTKEVRLNPDFLKAVSLVADGFRTAIAEGKKIAESIGVERLLNLAKGLGQLFGAVAVIVFHIVDGIARGLSIVVSSINFVRSIILSLTGLDILNPVFLGKIVSIIVTIATVMVTIQIALLAYGKLTTLFLFSLKGVVGVLRTIDILLGTSIVASLGKATKAAGGLGLALSSGLVANLLRAAGIIAAIALVADQLSSNPIIDFNSDSSEKGKALAKTRNDFRQKLGSTGLQNAHGGLAESLLDNPDREAKTTGRILALRKELADLGKNASSASDERVQKARAELAVWEAALPILQQYQERVDSINETMEADTKGFIQAQSEALKSLEDNLKKLRDEARAARDAVAVRGPLVGVGGAPGQEAALQAEGLLRRTKEIVAVSLEQRQIESDIAIRKKQIADKIFTDKRGEKEINAEIVALTSRQVALETAKRDLVNATLEAKTAEILLAGKQDIHDNQPLNAALQIQAGHSREERQAEESHEETKLSALRLQDTLAQKRLDDFHEEADLMNKINALARARSVVEDQVRADRAIINPTQDQQEQIETNRQTLAVLDEQTDQYRQQLDLNQQIHSDQEIALQHKATFAQGAVEHPEIAGMVEAFATAFEAVSDNFKTTLLLMTSAIHGFSDFVAQSIAGAFDPNNNETIQERFGRFLLSLATQIISTLVEIAVTAIVLNAASDGILGTMVQGLTVARGHFEGGPVAEGRYHGGPAERQTTRHRVAGYANGGRPTLRQMHGMFRPAGLHPKDTVPLWADPEEYILRGEAVQKISSAPGGADALDRINKGLFDPYLLSAATGLAPFLSGGTAAGAMGRYSGGSVGQSGGGAPSPLPMRSQGGDSIAVAVVAPSEESLSNMLRGGRTSMLTFLHENGFRRNG